MTNQPTSSPAPESADPSMEEILASIRRILNDDDVPAPPSPPKAAAEEPAEEEEDVLMLDDSMMVPASERVPDVAEAAPESAESEEVEPEADEPVVRNTAAPTEIEAPAQETMAATSPIRAEVEERPTQTPDLLAPEAAAAAASSVGSLVRTLAAGRATRVYGGGPTLEDLVRAELRPLLKEWLDTHLPPLVERLVRAEIEKVVGRYVP